MKYKGKIGFIGQGYVGKSYADDFEDRGFSVVRYAKEEPHSNNKDKLKECSVVFVAVPTPTTARGFDSSILRQVLQHITPQTTVVIKSTILPGTTELLQDEHTHLFIIHSPEFLSEVSAKKDAKHPIRNIIGIPYNNPEHRRRAEEVLSMLPRAPFEIICTAREAEMIKYSRNTYGYVNIVFTNIFYDLAQKVEVDWEVIRAALDADPMISSQYINPVHKSGRGAGGSCFIKDFEAFLLFHKRHTGRNALAHKVLESIRNKNLELLTSTNKDLDKVESLYGSYLRSKRNKKRLSEKTNTQKVNRKSIVKKVKKKRSKTKK